MLLAVASEWMTARSRLLTRGESWLVVAVSVMIFATATAIWPNGHESYGISPIYNIAVATVIAAILVRLSSPSSPPRSLASLT